MMRALSLWVLSLGILISPSLQADEPTLADVLKWLSSNDPALQHRALYELSHGGGARWPAVPGLIKVAQGGQRRDRLQALWILGSLEHRAREAVPPFADLLDESDARIRIGTAEALLQIEPRHERATTTLTTVLDDVDRPEDRLAAAQALARQASLNAAAGPALVKNASASDEPIREQVALALGSVDFAAADTCLPALRRLQADDATAVQLAAVKSLSRWDEPAEKLVPTLGKLVAGFRPDPKADILQQIHGGGLARGALDLLAEIGPEAKGALPAVIAATEYRPVGMRLAAVDALGAMQAEADEAIPVLAKALRDTESHSFPYAHRSWSVSRNAASALVKVGPAARPTLIAACADPDEAVRGLAADALAQLPPTDEAVAALLKLLDDPDPPVQAHAAFSLGRWGKAARRAVPRLSAMLNNEEEWLSFPGMGIGTRYAVADHVLAALKNIDPKAEEVVPHLAATIAKDRRISAALLHWLRDLGPKAKDAVPAIAPLLKDPEQKLVAALALARIEPGHAGVLETLSAALSEDEFATGLAAIPGLADLGAKAQAALPKLMLKVNDDTTPDEIRAPAAAAAIKIGGIDERAVVALAEALRDAPRDPELADELATWRGLGADARAALGLLREGLTYAEDNTQGSCSELARRQESRRLQSARLLLVVMPADRSAVAALIELCGATSSYNRGAAADELGRMAPAEVEAIPALVALLPDNEAYFEGGDFYGNGSTQHAAGDHAAAALARFGTAATPALQKQLSDADPIVQVRAAQALAAMGPAALPAAEDLRRLLTSRPHRVQSAAARALGSLEDRSEPTIASLASALVDKHVDVRTAAAEALGKLGPSAKSAKERLTNQLQDPYRSARQAAETALQRISE